MAILRKNKPPFRIQPVKGFLSNIQSIPHNAGMAQGIEKSNQPGDLGSALETSESPARKWQSFLLSTTIHTGLLVALALLWTSRVIGGGDEGPRSVQIVLASAADDNEYFEEADLEPTESPAENAAATAVSEDQSPIDVSELVNEVATIDMPLPGMNSSEMTSPTQTAALPAGQLSEAQRKMLAAESAAIIARQPKGPATTLRVFGSGNLSGRKFVFVIDRSRSMGAQGLNVLSAAAKELTQAINQLETYHEFQIVAYHHRTMTIERRELLNGTENNKKQVAGFINNLAAFGGTEHELAINSALSLNPDVIVLLTDGGSPELNESQVERLRRSAGGAQIHCVQFGQGPLQTKSNFMKQLAARNLGTYRYIDVNEWNQ